jgi:hypothetical protein
MQWRGLFRAAGLWAMSVSFVAHAAPATAGDFGRSDPSLFDKIGSLRPGDFDRPMPSVLDGLLPKQLTLGPVTRIPGDPLTDAEEELRNRAYDLIRLPQRRDEWKVILASARVAKALPPSVLWFDRKAYGNMLVGLPFRSEAGRYARLRDDVASDMMLVGPFLAVACQAIDMDVKRERSLAFVDGLTEWERGDALGRIMENRMVVGWVRHALEERHWSYRYAVARLVIASPSPAAIEAERLIDRFGLQIAEIEAQLAPCAGAQEVHRLITK